MAQTNPLTISTPALHPIPPLGHVRRHGQTKVQNKTAINTTTVHTPRLVLLQNSDPPLGLSYLLPPQSFPSLTLDPRPGLSYAAANTINTPLSPLHLLPALHHGLLYLIASSQPHKTAKMPNNESRQSPESFRMKFLFSFIYLFTITHINNPDLCTLLYPYITIPPTHHTLSATPTTTLLCPVLFHFLLCEGTHRNALSTFLIF